MSQPLISVVMPTLNQAQYIRQAVDSVLAQDYPAIELIVVDGRSRDGTLDILRSYGDRVAWTSEKDRNLAEAVNKGIRRSRGDLIYSLASDEILLPGALSTFGRYAQDSRVNIIVGNGLMIDESGEVIGEINVPRPCRFEDILTLRTKMPFACSCFRRSVWERHPFDEEFAVCTDFMFWLSVLEQVEVTYVDERVACWRRQPESWSVRADGAVTMFEARLKALDKYLATHPDRLGLYPRAFVGACCDLMEHHRARGAYGESLRVFGGSLRQQPLASLQNRLMCGMALSSVARFILTPHRSADKNRTTGSD
jgi:glycosyltransferase involved in cell wall biosynthesis